jgi:hypothetical protein
MVRLMAAGVAILLLVFAGAATPALVVCARTPSGRLAGLFGVGFVTFCGAGSVWLCAPHFGAERSTAAGLVALAAVPVLFVGFLVGRRPEHIGTGPIHSYFLAGAPVPGPAGWADLEDEYVWLVVLLVTRFDPLMPRAEARAARAKIGELLFPAAVPDYACGVRIGSVVIRRLLRGELDLRHCFSYRPAEREPGERFGLLVFLHGHGSNYPFVVAALRALCDRLRLSLVAPTFGYGNWEAPGGAGAVERATRFGLSAFGADPARVFLGGISQGGAGVSRGGAAHPELYAGLIFISPTLEPEVIDSPAFCAGWKGRPVLVIQGQRDRNVHPRTVDAAVGLMEAAGVLVTQHRDPDGGHFLFFARLDEVTSVISAWVGESQRRGC